MFRFWTTTVVSLLICAGTGCDSGQHSPAGFRLPPSGDAERGRIAFVSHDCHNCHTVAGVDLPAPKAPSATRIALGGATPRRETDGYLVTSIINPSYVLAASVRRQPRAPGEGRHMPEYAEELTVRELTDIVAFLQSKYSVQRYPDSF